MKPIYIKMSAFGSYAGEEIIDFTDINSGIFLITEIPCRKNHNI